MLQSVCHIDELQKTRFKKGDNNSIACDEIYIMCYFIAINNAIYLRKKPFPPWNTTFNFFLLRFPIEYIVLLSKYTVNTLVVRKSDDL